MRKTITSVSAIIVCLAAIFITTGFNTIPSALSNTSKAQRFKQSEPVVFFTTATSAEGTTYFGTVDATGGINATGSYVMPTEMHGLALHCTLMLTLPNGTLTIRMNCNMKTLDGRWKILEGTGAYQNAKGGGSLIMPNDTNEILTGNISWK
jgi:hypothetical protein